MNGILEEDEGTVATDSSDSEYDEFEEAKDYYEA